MDIRNIVASTTAWTELTRTEHKGEKGTAYWISQQFDNIQVRLVEYSPGYLDNHWCTKGHILFCLDGELSIELADGKKFLVSTGMSFQVAGNAEPHRGYTATGAKILIVD